MGRDRAAPDGSFAIAVPPPPDRRISVLYGSALPALQSEVNVAAIVPGYSPGSASASSSYGGSAPELAFNANLYDGWNSGGHSSGWLLRDLGRVLELGEVRLWFMGGNQSRWARVGVSQDGVAFTPVVEGSMTAPQSSLLESPTMSLSLPAGTLARWVKVEADNSSDWTALFEVAVLGKVPAAEAVSAPEWTLPEGKPLAGAPAVIGKYGQSGLPWGSISGWPDPDACWVWARPLQPLVLPGATARFRAAFSVPSATEALLYVAADDGATVWLDGVPVLYGQWSGYYAGAPLRIPPGDHVLAFSVKNSSGDAAGLLVSLRTLAGQTLVRSGQGAWEAEQEVPAWLLPGPAGDFSGVPVVTPRNSAWTAGPDPGTSWVWTCAGDAPAGTVRFRRPFSLSAAADVTVSVAVDNEAYLWVDGVPLIRWTSYASTGSATVSLAAGDHVLAVEAVNGASYPNPAGLLVSAKDGSGAVILHTGDQGWQTSGYVVP